VNRLTRPLRPCICLDSFRRVIGLRLQFAELALGFAERVLEFFGHFQLFPAPCQFLTQLDNTLLVFLQTLAAVVLAYRLDILLHRIDTFAYNAVNLTRYHGILAPNHRWRGPVTPARRGKGIKSISNAVVCTPAVRHAAMTWGRLPLFAGRDSSTTSLHQQGSQ